MVVVSLGVYGVLFVLVLVIVYVVVFVILLLLIVGVDDELDLWFEGM